MHPSEFNSEQEQRDLPTRGLVPALSASQALSLHARLIARDEGALAELIDVMTPWLLGLAQGLLEDAHEAEEVVQESFTIVWTKIGHAPSEPGGLLAWVLRVTRNRAIDRLRARRRHVRKLAHLAANVGEREPFARPEQPNEAGTPGWHVHQAIHSALAALPDEQQTVVSLAYFHGLTHSAIAQRLAIPVGTVKTRLRLAFDKLRRALAPMKDWVL